MKGTNQATQTLPLEANDGKVRNTLINFIQVFGSKRSKLTKFCFCPFLFFFRFPILLKTLTLSECSMFLEEEGTLKPWTLISYVSIICTIFLLLSFYCFKPLMNTLSFEFIRRVIISIHIVDSWMSFLTCQEITSLLNLEVFSYVIASVCFFVCQG